MNRAERRRLAREMSKLTDTEATEIQNHLRRLVPPHINDQVDAATADAARRLRRLADTGDYQTGEVMPPPELKQRLNEILVAGMSGDVKYCRHATSPQPLTVALWEEPLTVRCVTCAVADHKPLDDVEDNTCDVCRTHDPEGVYGQLVQVGVLLVSFGACDDCRQRIYAGAP